MYISALWHVKFCRINKVYETNNLYDLIDDAFFRQKAAGTRYEQADYSQQYADVFTNLNIAYGKNANKFFTSVGHDISDMLLE